MLFPLLEKIVESKILVLQLVVGGTHLLEEFGNTVDEIIEDGFEITKRIDYLNDTKSDGKPSLSKAMARLTESFGVYLQEFKPDLVFLVGDRFELLPVANCCLLDSVPISHMSGGDVTEGVIDDQIRHAMTKLSHLHFTGNPNAARNVVRLGEEPSRVNMVGTLSLDRIRCTSPIDKKELFDDLGIEDRSVISVTFHPETITCSITPQFVTEVTKAVQEATGYQMIVSGSNADEGAHEINEAFIKLANEEKGIHFFMSLGQRRYFSLLSYCSLVLGNSSSGVVEAKLYDLPVLNIGTRQQGRPTNSNVIHVPADTKAVVEMCKKALTESFRQSYIDEVSVYGDGFTSERVIETLENCDFSNLFAKNSVFGEQYDLRK